MDDTDKCEESAVQFSGDTTDARPSARSDLLSNIRSAGQGSHASATGDHGASSDRYPMNCAQRGLAIIVNNRKFAPKTKMPERSGTESDYHAMNQRYRELGFIVHHFHNVTLDQMKHILIQASSTDHSNFDCFSMTILTHGEEGVLYMTDGTIPADDVFTPFKGYNCPTLIGKPKLFFIQACRGVKLDEGVEVPEGPGAFDLPDYQTPKIPQEADILLAFSVVPGYFSWRNSTNGSWFIQALSRVLEEDGKTKELLAMLTRVNRMVAYEFESNAMRADMSQKKQIPCFSSMLTKEVYFHPKT